MEMSKTKLTPEQLAKRYQVIKRAAIKVAKAREEKLRQMRLKLEAKRLAESLGLEFEDVADQFGIEITKTGG